jgi:hypothetical protein
VFRAAVTGPPGRRVDVMRRSPRSPVERYIRVRLLRAPDVPADEIARQLDDEGVPVDERYVEKLRAEMVVPDRFEPENLSNVQSQQFLRQWGVWSMFFPSSATQEASTAFNDLQVRRALQLLITAGADDERILEITTPHLEVVLSLHGLAEFRRYYWDIQILTRPELAVYSQEQVKDEELAVVAKMPPGGTTIVRAQVALGMLDDHLDPRRMLEDHMNRVAAVDAMIPWCVPPGAGQAAAMRQTGKALIEVRKDLAASVPPEDKYEEVQRFVATTRDMPNPSLKDIQDGINAPIPVGLLLGNPDDDDDGDKKKD